MKKFWISLRMFVWMSLITGILYPLLITAIAQLTMPHQASGSFISKNGKTVGSTLISQKFVSDKYFWGRPSAIDYNPIPSGGSNLGPTSAALKKAVEERQSVISKAQGLTDVKSIPSELLFASGSGLDPHISPATAHFQIDRIVKARGLDAKTGKESIAKLIEKYTERRRLWFLGEPVVNVLKLNLALDILKEHSTSGD